MKVYLDNGATTKVDPIVALEIKKYLLNDYGNPSSIHSFGVKAHEILESSRLVIAKSINAQPNEIIFTSGGTESDNIALKGFCYANKHKGNHIITTVIEHPAVLNTVKSLEKEGFKVTILPVNKEGFIDLRKLEDAISKDTILVSVMHANNEIGVIQDIKKIGEICKKYNVCFHSDAVQSYTKSKIDVKEQNISLLSLSAHKIHGQKGVGALYIKNGVKISKLFDGGGQEFNLRSGTQNIPGIAGFAKAVSVATEDHVRQMTELRDYIIKNILDNIKDVVLNGPLGEKRLCNNINLSFKNVEGESILLYLDSENICVSTGSACSQKSLKPSTVLISLGLKPEYYNGSIRITISRYTTKKEADYLLKKLPGIIKKLREISNLR